MTNTTTTILDEYQDDGPDEWPYPDIHRTVLVEGDLADRILVRVGQESGRVTITETEISGGYSEYTQETDYEFSVEVDGEEVFSSDYGLSSVVSDIMYPGSSYGYGSIHRLNNWLKEADNGTTE